MGSIASNIESINTTKSQLKEKLNYLFDFGLTSSSTFRSYATELLKMYNESPTTSEQVSDDTVAEGYTVLGYKASYLKNTKELIKEGLTLLGTNPSNTFDTYPSLLDVVYDTYPKSTGEGSSITLSPVRKGLIRSSIEGNTEQQTYSGKNLLNATATTETKNGITFTKNNDGSWTINGTSTEYTSKSLGTVGLTANTTYTLSGGGLSGTYFIQALNGEGYPLTNSNGYITFTQINNYNANIYIVVQANKTVNNVILKPMIEKGSSATSYEKYVGGTASPNPDYPQEVKVVKGESLLDFSNYTSISGTGTTFSFTNDILTVENTTGTYNQIYYDILNLVKANSGKTIRLDIDSATFTGSSTRVDLMIIDNGTTTYQKLIETNGTVNNYTIPSDTTNLTRVWLRIISNNSNTSQSGSVVLNKPILHFGSGKIDYLPYNAVGIKKQNKNLFDKDSPNIINAFLNWRDGTTTANPTYRVSDYINVSGFDYITVSGNGGNSENNCFYDKNKNYVSYFGMGTDSTKTATVPSNAKYLRCTINSNNLNEYQVERGNQATPYEEHKETIYPLTLEGDNLFDKDNATVLSAFVNGNTGLLSSPTNNQKSVAIQVQPNTQYTISGVERSSSNYGMYDDTTLTINTSTATTKGNITNGKLTFTTGANTKWFVFLIGGGTETYGYSNVRLEKGTTIFPNFLGKIGTYQDRIYRTSGKNLLNHGISSMTLSGLTLTVNSDKTITINGTATSTVNLSFNNVYLDEGTYTLSGTPSGGASNKYLMQTTLSGSTKEDVGSGVSFTLNDRTSVSVMLKVDSGTVMNNITFKPMINTGNVSLTYEPYGATGWYLHKEIGKVVLNGTESGWSYPSANRFNLDSSKINDYLKSKGNITYLSNYYEAFNQTDDNGSFNTLTTNTNYGFNLSSTTSNNYTVRFKNADITSVADFKTWLGTHNTEVYYVLATPQEIKIEGTLEEQLENLWDMYAYEPITYLDGIGDIGPIINASALAKR